MARSITAAGGERRGSNMLIDIILCHLDACPTPHILIADDDRQIRTSLKVPSRTDSAFPRWTAWPCSGDRKQPHHVVVLDIMMPGGTAVGTGTRAPARSLSCC
jgi:hypothetical protein